MKLPPLPKTYFRLYTPSDGYCNDHLTSWDGWDDEQMRAYAEAAVLAERERIAAHFDSRDKGSGGFYEPHEPAEIIRALGPNAEVSRQAGREGVGT